MTSDNGLEPSFVVSNHSGSLNYSKNFEDHKKVEVSSTKAWLHASHPYLLKHISDSVNGDTRAVAGPLGDTS